MNNSFDNCIMSIAGLELSTVVRGVKYSVFDGKAIVVEGHNGISEYSESTVSFKTNKGKLVVEGDNLKIKCLQKHYAVIVGGICQTKVIHDK